MTTAAIRSVATSEERWSPVIVDLYGIGYPDLLAGSEAWPQGRQAPSEDLDVYRGFELVPGTYQLTEWVGPKVGILVVENPMTLKPPDWGNVSAVHLLGNFMGGGKWKNGYHAMSWFDKNKDGFLKGTELDPVYIWVDGNTNAFLEPGELMPAKDLLRSLEVVTSPELWSATGAELLDGTLVSTWDWFPHRQPRRVNFHEVLLPILKPPISGVDKEPEVSALLYEWQVPGMNGNAGLMRFFKVGTDVYVATMGPDFPRTRSMNIGIISKDGDELSWTLGDGWTTLKAEMTLGPDGHLKGKLYQGEQILPFLARPFSVDRIPKLLPLLHNVFALPDESFVQAVIEGRGETTGVVIPPGKLPWKERREQSLPSLFL